MCKLKLIKLFLILLFNVPVMWASKVNAQNEPSGQINECIPVLPNGFNFLKSFEVNEVKSSNGKLEYSYPFAKDTRYIVNICEEGVPGKGIVITLYDFHRHKLATSKMNGRYLSAILFKCKTTGIYYITYTFENTMKFCGQSILGFQK